MAEKIYLCLFILCVILCQGNIGVSSEDVGESNSFIRRKRVINLEPGGDVPLVRGDAPFVVNIKDYYRNHTFCVGTILSKRTVITSASCVAGRADYSLRVTCSSVYKNSGVLHSVIEKKVHLSHHPQRSGDGIALLIVEPAFHFNTSTDSIQLHEGPLLPQTPATIFGWGCNPTTPRGTQYLLRLRSITLPIMRHQDCVDIYRNQLTITDKDICTYHENKRCGHTDGGAPLVVDNKLAGIYLWTVRNPGRRSPDVFVDIQNLEYGPWIRNNIVYTL